MNTLSFLCDSFLFCWFLGFTATSVSNEESSGSPDLLGCCHYLGIVGTFKAQKPALESSFFGVSNPESPLQSFPGARGSFLWKTPALPVAYPGPPGRRRGEAETVCRHGDLVALANWLLVIFKSERSDEGL